MRIEDWTVALEYFSDAVTINKDGTMKASPFVYDFGVMD